jgi:hypothetical protein
MDQGLVWAMTGCLVWIPVAIWILGLIQWMVMDEIDVLSGLLGIAAALMLAMAPLLGVPREYTPLLFMAAVGTIVMFPFVRAGMNRRELASIDIEAMARAYEALAERPNNVAAMFKLARLAYAKGMPAHAIAIAENAVANMPKQHFMEEHRMVAQWKKAMPPGAVARSLACVDCGVPVAPGPVHCPRCGAPFLLDHVGGRIVGRGMGRKLLAAWVAMIALLLGIPMAAALPPAAAVAAILTMLVAAVLVLFLAFRPEARALNR